MNLDNLLSGALGAFFLYLIQFLAKTYSEEKKNKDTKRAIMFHLKGVIVPGLEKLILEYKKTYEILSLHLNENKGGEIIVLNFNELNSEYLKFEKFRNYIQHINNQEIHILYLNLIALLDGFTNEFPADFMLTMNQVRLADFTEKDKRIHYSEILFKIKVNVDNSHLALDRVNRLIEQLEFV